MWGSTAMETCPSTCISEVGSKKFYAPAKGIGTSKRGLLYVAERYLWHVFRMGDQRDKDPDGAGYL